MHYYEYSFNSPSELCQSGLNKVEAHFSFTMMSRNATPYFGTQLNCLLVRLARHCPLVSNPGASVAPELAEGVGIRSRVRSFSERSYGGGPAPS